MTIEFWSQKSPPPICVGTGLVALDVVVHNDLTADPKLWAGGSCGNVMSILAFVGWNAYPIARLKNDTAAELLVSDLTRCGVRTDLIERSESGSTPVIVEKLGISRKGTPSHKFEWTCPRCGAWLPRYRPVLERSTEALRATMPASQVFYFDRISRSSITLAAESKAKGALIVFEPSGMTDPKQFQECLKIADVIKYSDQRLKGLSDITDNCAVPLEIETLGADGLRYRMKGKSARKSKWYHLAALPVPKIVDAAGAGDWCTAGLINAVGKRGTVGFQCFGREEIEEGLRFGQALAAVNCNYVGARGSIYSLSKSQFTQVVDKLLKSDKVTVTQSKRDQKHESGYSFCSECGETRAG
ncbi:MAG TPA: PfkB family carbohydrate kinase [Oculatellaceae cyanobacterium]